MYSPEAIANHFINLSVANDLTPIKLVKLVYYAHGWHLAITDKPLLNEQIQAREFGPVVRRLYDIIVDIGYSVNSIITKPFYCLRMKDGKIEEYDPSINDEADRVFLRAFLNRIWTTHGQFSENQLANMSHEPGSPWDQIRQQYSHLLEQSVPIPNELISAFFKKKIVLTEQELQQGLELLAAAKTNEGKDRILASFQALDWWKEYGDRVLTQLTAVEGVNLEKGRNWLRSLYNSTHTEIDVCDWFLMYGEKVLQNYKPRK